MNINIRKSDITDLAQLAILFDEYRVFYEKTSDIAAAEEFLAERIKQKDAEIFVAEDEAGKLLGFVQLYPLFSSTRLQKLWLLNDLYVSPDERGKGISIVLVERAKQLCAESNACGLMLETAKSNVIGNKLYPKLDFQLDTEHNYYYWDK